MLAFDVGNARYGSIGGLHESCANDVPTTMMPQDSRWKPCAAAVGLPRALHHWIADPGSLTARIVARCSAFQVHVLNERRCRPFHDECTLIGLPPDRHAWTREVLLMADEVPVVFAHSVLAPRDLTGAWHMARAIGCRPLGAALFADPAISRGTIHASCLDASHPLHRHATASLAKPLPRLWARRSRFCRLGRPLLVTEVFLPGILSLEA